jgi:hypothetical protein
MFTDVLRTSARCVSCWHGDQSGQYDHAKHKWHLALRYRYFCLPQSFSASHLTAAASYDVAEVRGLGLCGAWVKHAPPKRLRNASAVAASGKQNRIYTCLTSRRLRPRRTGMRRSWWNASISRKTLRKPSGGSARSTRCGKSRSFLRPMISRLR